MFKQQALPMPDRKTHLVKTYSRVESICTVRQQLSDTCSISAGTIPQLRLQCRLRLPKHTVVTETHGAYGHNETFFYHLFTIFLPSRMGGVRSRFGVKWGQIGVKQVRLGGFERAGLRISSFAQ